MKTKRSFMNVPTLKRRLEVMEKVMTKKRMPYETTDFFLRLRRAYTTSATQPAKMTQTKGLEKSVMAIWCG